MDIVKQLETFRSQMSARERETTDRILSNLKPLANDSAKEAAETYKTSTATLVRLAKRIGLSGYSELSFQTKQFIDKNVHRKENVKQDNKLIDITKGFNEAITNIATKDNSDKLETLIEKIHDSERTFVIGFGYTGLVADYLKYMFLSFGKALNCFDSMAMVKHIYQVLQPGDVVIVFSVSGSVKQYKELYAKCKKVNAYLVIVTMNSGLDVLKQAKLSFVLPTVSVINNNFKVQSVDSQPVFWVFASALTWLYQDNYLVE